MYEQNMRFKFSHQVLLSIPCLDTEEQEKEAQEPLSFRRFLVSSSSTYVQNISSIDLHHLADLPR